MLKYTICFIKRGEEILLLNRERAPWMGIWNGVGGKLEPGETPGESILREIREETGIGLASVRFKGLVTLESKEIPAEAEHDAGLQAALRDAVLR